MGRRQKRAFTLIELLVVIAVIAVLMAILMPALSRAREAGKTVKCQANLRTLTTAWYTYAVDNDDKLCGSWNYNGGGWGQPSDWAWAPWQVDGDAAVSDYFNATRDERYEGIRRVVFADHGFAADVDWLAELAQAYPQRLSLPFRCHVRLNAARGEVPELLARAGCDAVDVEIGSGSNFIRQDVLAMRTSERDILDGVAALRRAGLSVRGRVFIGAPYESEVSLRETFDLLCRIRLDEVRPRVFYPISGTRAAEICAENGWISGRSEESFFLNQTVLDMPSLRAERINDIAQRFGHLLKRHSGRGLSGRLARLRDISTRPLRFFRRGSP